MMKEHIANLTGIESAWLFGTTIGGLTLGISWLMIPVEIPLWAVLALTFIPTERLIGAAQAYLPDPPPPRDHGTRRGDTRTPPPHAPSEVNKDAIIASVVEELNAADGRETAGDKQNEDMKT